MRHALIGVALLVFWTASLWSAPQVSAPPAGPGAFGQCGATAGKIWKTDAAGILQCSDDAGASTGAPTDSQYWVGAADGTLSAEKNLAALATGLVLNTAGTPSAYGGAACTDQVIEDLSASGVPVCRSITGAYVTDGGLTDADVAAANKDGLAATLSLRTLGSGAQQAAGGTDARFPTADEKAAMADSALGTAPTGSNLFVVSDDSRLPSMVTPSALSAASQITCSKPTVYIAGSGGPVTLTDPAWLVAGSFVGQTCTVIGSHATNTVTAPSTTGVRLAGNAGSVVFGLNQSGQTFVWTGTQWIQISVPSLEQAKNVNPVMSMAACGTASNPVYDGGSGNKFEFCLDGTTPTLKGFCSGSQCLQTPVTNLVLEVTGGKPPCAAGERGKVWFTSSGAGVEDILELCRKVAGDTYAWTSIDLP